MFDMPTAERPPTVSLNHVNQSTDDMFEVPYIGPQNNSMFWTSRSMHHSAQRASNKTRRTSKKTHLPSVGSLTILFIFKKSLHANTINGASLTNIPGCPGLSNSFKLAMSYHSYSLNKTLFLIQLKIINKSKYVQLYAIK